MCLPHVRDISEAASRGAVSRHVLGSVFARAGCQLGSGIIAGNCLILLLAWRADSLTADLLVSSVITSVIMAAVTLTDIEEERAIVSSVCNTDLRIRCTARASGGTAVRSVVTAVLPLALSLAPPATSLVPESGEWVALQGLSRRQHCCHSCHGQHEDGRDNEGNGIERADPK